MRSAFRLEAKYALGRQRKERVLKAVGGEGGAFDSVQLLLSRGIRCSVEEAKDAARTFTLGESHARRIEICVNLVRERAH